MASHGCIVASGDAFTLARMATHMLSFHCLMPHDLHGRLQAYAHRRGMVASEVIRRALAKHLDDELELVRGTTALGGGTAPIGSTPATPSESN
jgi:hypothetical protein